MICEKCDKSSIEVTAKALKEGKVVIVPTDTVYGFSAIVDLKGNAEYYADNRIRAIKGRSETKPLICLLSDVSELKKYTNDIIPQKVLASWPGALTVIVNIKEDSPLAHYAPTVAFRIPGDEWIRKVIAECGSPIYSTSVNRSGKSVLEHIADIENEFASEVDLIVRDGDKTGALPSTLISITGNNEIKILRQGSVII